MEAIRRRVRVEGTVQGVFFRADTRKKALSLGLSGWVRNTPDGAVEAVFEGESAAVMEAVDWCRHGSPRAEVLSVNVTDEELRGESGFRIAG